MKKSFALINISIYLSIVQTINVINFNFRFAWAIKKLLLWSTNVLCFF